ncbi:MAG: hypothetical protein JF607_09995 [Burkholderiales bacterium]|nr:hypothetical protein [Burkholderiales bacterium]
MGHSSLVGTDKAPRRPKGTDEQSLGPSDITDSGSDIQGADALPAADPGEPVDVTLNRDQAFAPIEGTGEEADETEASDIGPDRVIDTADDAGGTADVEREDTGPPGTPRRGKPQKPG